MKAKIYKSLLVLLLFIFTISCKKENTITDIDGNTYRTFKIGQQIWMAENLKTTHFDNGEPIANLADKTQWKQTQKAAYSAYNNNNSLEKEYGYLYNHYCIDNNKKLAPKGWRIPTEEDIKILENYLNSQTASSLKEKENAHWLSNNPEEISSGFNALPGGYRDEEGNFYMLQSNGYFWTENTSIELYHWSKRMFQAFADVRRDRVYKQYGFSIRCIKEE